MSDVRDAVIKQLAKVVTEAAKMGDDLPPDTATAIANAVLVAILAMDDQ